MLFRSGIGVQIHYIPVHTQPYYRQLGFNWGDLPESEAYYQEAISLPIQQPIVQPHCQSSHHLYVIRLKLEKIRRSKREIFSLLREQGIGVQIHYIPVHTQPYYRQLGFEWGNYPASESYCEEAISLPIHYDLSDAEHDRIIQTLKEVIL